MGSIVVCNSVRNRHVDWVGPDRTMWPVTGPCPAAISSLAARGNAPLVGVHRSSDGTAWRGCDGGVVSHQGSRRYRPRCAGLAVAAGAHFGRRIKAPDVIDRVAALRRGSSPEENRDEDRQLTLEDCCGSILDRRIDEVRRRDVISIVAPVMALGARVLRAAGAGRCLDDFRWREFPRPPHGHRRGRHAVATEGRDQSSPWLDRWGTSLPDVLTQVAPR